MRLYNRNGILYIDINGKRTSTKLKDTPSNRKFLENQHRNDEFYQKFNVKIKAKTVIEFCEEVLEEKEKKLQPTTMKAYNSLFQSRIIPFFDKKNPHEILPRHLKEWYSTFKDKSTLATCVNGILKLAFENAIIEGYIKNSPFIVSFPTFKSYYEMKPFNLQEIKLLLDNSTGWLRNFLGIAFFTGARTGEILALEWKDIDFDEKTININKTRTSGITKSPKTKSSNRIIDMLPQCETFLREQRRITGLKQNIFLRKSNTLFHHSGELALDWYKLLKELNLGKRNIYQTRHSFASNMLSNKENPLWVSQMLGHKNLNVTLEKYTQYIKVERDERKTTFLDEENINFAQS
ncbi:site-specific integrase [Arcobacter lanthieri]|uniref:site-specific integrase n=1 Tax=Aliarcobacter lanthieri TaxID=1355374 RepID=UPI001922D731|nr:site-specific integrase [Aliarcobacter lanthieri]MBL3519465.1 site-specific integrase [Aliarcobacter lanthieri]